MPVKRKCWFFTDCTRKNVMIARHNSKSDTFLYIFMPFILSFWHVQKIYAAGKGAQWEM